jgi:Fe-S oxidoreductase
MVEDLSAEVLITACPTCKQSFTRHTNQSDSIETMDIVELVAVAAGL